VPELMPTADLRTKSRLETDGFMASLSILQPSVGTVRHAVKYRFPRRANVTAVKKLPDTGKGERDRGTSCDTGHRLQMAPMS
jgi:hypothetical protein